jgi:hypothetical protein
VPLVAGIGLLGAAVWHVAAQVRYTPVTEADVAGMRPVHYFAADGESHPALFEWSFSESEFQLQNERGSIPKELIGKLLQPGATADEIRGKWKLVQPAGETSQQLVLTEITAGTLKGKKDVRLAIWKTAPGVIRVGDPQVVFVQGRPDTREPAGEQPGKTRLEFRSGAILPGLALHENQGAVHWLTLTADIDAKGEGRGTLTLDPTPPEFDEFGNALTGTEIDLPAKAREPLQVEEIKCRLEHVRTGAVGRVNEESIIWSLYRVKSPRIKPVVYLAISSVFGQPHGRILIHGPQENKVARVIDLLDARPPERPLPPCHPGCFPAGTRVLVPGGTRPIDRLRAGDLVLTVSGDGEALPAAVAHVFTTQNQLVELRTDHGSLVATRTQPVCLVVGGFRETGKLTAGDRIWQWRGGSRKEAVVQEVADTGRQQPVFNLIVGESAIFVAEDFLVRGKPPALISTPAAN